MERPSWDEYFLQIVRDVAQRGTCIRRRFGAIIVSQDYTILSTGYAGAPRGTPNCIELNRCYRQERSISSGEHYEKCRSVHAEMNAIINAAREGHPILGAKLYLFGVNPDGSIVGGKPCKMCRRAIINVGIVEVIVQENNGIKTYKVSDWIKEANDNPFAELDEIGY